MLHGKKILLGITGSIAAYKSAHLVRLLVKAGAEVQVIMTSDATGFVTPLTLSTLSGNPVYDSFTSDDTGHAVWNNHVDLALWADLFLIAPVTSNTMGKMAHGLCDNLLTAVYASAKCPVYFAPAMDLDMHANPANQENIERLVSFGNIHIPSATGELASGLVGEGRMAEPEEIAAFIEEHLMQRAPLKGKLVLINAGPTYEAIDAVRFIGNHSSGKMGVALAEEALELGARVHLVLGPSGLNPVHSRLMVQRVTSTAEMYAAVMKKKDEANIIILSAAVSDFRPKESIGHKRKKSDGEMTIELELTEDILTEVGKNHRKDQTLVGFALETDNEEEYALDKLKRKNADMIVLNSLRHEGAAFGSDTNRVVIFDRNKKRTEIPLKSKRNVASDIFAKILELHA